MNQKIRMGVGILCFVLGGISFINALFVEKLDFGNESVVSAIRASIALLLFGAGYYLVFRKKEIKTVKI